MDLADARLPASRVARPDEDGDLRLTGFAAYGDDVAGAEVLAELESGLVAEPLELLHASGIRTTARRVVRVATTCQAMRRDADDSHAEILKGDAPTADNPGRGRSRIGSMRRTVQLFLAGLIALGAWGLPVRASGTAWEDDAGDATALGAEHTIASETSPRPNDPELDIRTVTLDVEGDSIVATAATEEGGLALGSGGSVWRFFFTHEDQRYFFQALAASAEYSQVFTSSPGFYRLDPSDPDPTSNGEALRCDCKMSVDLDAGTVRYSIKTDAVAKTLKSAPGSIELADLELRTFRRMQFYVLADISPAPDNTVFRA